ncbi:MAG: NACHT domain-containing protein [Chitinophagales bacterium]|nr:NACHT domain-containing protein [Chitinophagales bacterium]
MQINWTNIKAEILAETKDILQTEPNFNADEVLDLFVKVIEKKQLTEFKGALPFPTENHTGIQLKTARATLAVKFETYLKSIYELLSIEIEGELKVCLVDFFKRFSLLQPNRDSFMFFDKDDQTLVSLYPAVYFQGKMPFGKELKMAYDLRNAIAHKGKLYGNIEPSNNLETVISDIKDFVIAMLFITRQFKKELIPILNPNDLTDYLQKQRQLFKVWQSRFVHIEGREEFAEVELYAKEVLEDTEETNEDDENFEDIKVAREGKIDELRKRITEKQMVILGEVGMGKSTTLQYLHFKDAQSALQNKHLPIPIYFELKNLTDKDNLLQKIIDRIGKDQDFTIEMLKKGRFSICLDGLNEIEKNIKAKVFTQIKNLISDYPNNFYLITSRPQGYNREFDDVLQNRNTPVFVLQKMENKQISEFLEKNGKKVKDYIQAEIDTNDRLRKIVQTPLMLLMLIAVVEKEGKIPTNKALMIAKFMHSLYDREQKQIIDFDKDTCHLLLCYLGYQTRDLTGSNSGLDREEYILPILEERKKQLGLPVNLLDFLRKALDLNILVNDDNQYSFTHEQYQEYYAADFLMQFKKLQKNEK